MKKLNEKQLQVLANSYARKHGWGRATKVVFGNINDPKIIKTTSRGYRKFTTGEYVPNSYRANFGWKNTYYQAAETVVMLPLENINWN
jgi:hypothetical protein